MRLSPIVLSVAFATMVAAQSAVIDAAIEAFKLAGIVPDIIPDFDPSASLSLTFTDPLTHGALNVTAGANLTTEQVTNAPVFSLGLTQSISVDSELFVMIGLDPDAVEANGTVSPFRLLLQAGLTVTAGSATLLNASTPSLTNYLAPSAGAAPHRILFLAYKQSDNFTATASEFLDLSDALDARFGFNLGLLVQGTGLGEVVAGSLVYVSNSTSTSSSNSSIPGGSSNGTSTSGNGTSGGGSSANGTSTSHSSGAASTRSVWMSNAYSALLVVALLHVLL